MKVYVELNTSDCLGASHAEYPGIVELEPAFDRGHVNSTDADSSGSPATNGCVHFLDATMITQPGTERLQEVVDRWVVDL